MRRNDPTAEHMLNISPGDLVSYNAGGSRQSGIVLRRMIRTVEPLNPLGVERNSVLTSDCVQVMWSTDEAAGFRPEPFDRWSQEPSAIMWYPVMTSGGWPVFKVISTVEEYRNNG